MPADIAVLIVYALLAPFVLFIPTHPLLNFAVTVPMFGFLPGYAAIAALFPQGKASVREGQRGVRSPYRMISALERIAFSVGTSVALVPLLGLTLSTVLSRLTMVSITLSLVGVTLVATVLAWERRMALATENRLRVPYRRWITGFVRPRDLGEVAVNAVLLASIVVLVGTFAYTTI